MRDFVADWHALHAQWGDDDRGLPAFAARVVALDRVLDDIAPSTLPDGTRAAEAIRQHLLRPALGPRPPRQSPAQPSPAPPSLGDNARRRPPRRLDRPVFIVSPPRSGSTLMLETLAGANGMFTIGGESHEVFEGIPALHPANRAWSSNVLGAQDATPEVVNRLEESFIARCADRRGRPPTGSAPLRLLETTPNYASRSWPKRSLMRCSSTSP